MVNVKGHHTLAKSFRQGRARSTPTLNQGVIPRLAVKRWTTELIQGKEPLKLSIRTQNSEWKWSMTGIYLRSRSKVQCWAMEAVAQCMTYQLSGGRQAAKLNTVSFLFPNWSCPSFKLLNKPTLSWIRTCSTISCTWSIQRAIWDRLLEEEALVEDQAKVNQIKHSTATGCLRIKPCENHNIRLTCQIFYKNTI